MACFPRVEHQVAVRICINPRIEFDRTARCEVFALETGIIRTVALHLEHSVVLMVTYIELRLIALVHGAVVVYGASVEPDDLAGGRHLPQLPVGTVADERIAVG